MPVQPKQINKIQAAKIRVAGFSASGANNTVTTPITTALSTAGDGGVSVPLQVSASNGLGVITAAPNNLVEIFDSTTGDSILASGAKVYGRLTEAGGVYTLTYFTLPDSGTQTAHTMPATTIDFEFAYRFDFARFPTDAGIGIRSRTIGDDPASSGAAATFVELLTPTAQNTLPVLTKTPVSAGLLLLRINGVDYDSFGGGSAYFTLAGKTVTLSAANLGFNVETTDRVVAVYSTTE